MVRGPRATAIVLDASGSMRYRLEDRTLFERARSDALGALAALTPEEPATLVVCGAEAPAAEPPGFDRRGIQDAIERAEATAAHSDLTACVAAAVRALSAAKAQEGLPKRLVIATDLAASAWRLDVPAPAVEGPQGAVRPEVSVLDAARGAPLPNHAVVGLEAEPDPSAGPRGYKVTALVANHAAEPASDVPLTLQTGAGGAARTAIRAFAELPASGTTRKTLLHAFPEGGPVPIQVALPGDALQDDDARALVLNVPREVRALVVDGAPSPVRYRDEAYFVDSALASPASPVRPRMVDAEAFPAEDLSKVDVVFLLNVRSLGAKAAELARFVEQGGGLFISVGDQVDPEVYQRELGALLPMPLHVEKSAGEGRSARFAEVDLEHPALSIFTGDAREGLLGVRTQRYLLAKPGPAAGRAAGRGGPRAGELRRRRAGAGRGAAREGAGAALHLERRPRLDRLAHPHELPAGHAALRRVPGRRRGRAARGPGAGGRPPDAPARRGRGPRGAGRAGRPRAPPGRARAGRARRGGAGRPRADAARARALAGEDRPGRAGAPRAPPRLRGLARSPRVGHPPDRAVRADRLVRGGGSRQGGGAAGAHHRRAGAAALDRPAGARDRRLLPGGAAARVSGCSARIPP